MRDILQSYHPTKRDTNMIFNSNCAKSKLQTNPQIVFVAVENVFTNQNTKECYVCSENLIANYK